jgi:hypothetical protein
MRLNHVHKQRITEAVNVARRPGCSIRFSVDGDPDDGFLVWRHGQRHVIARGSRAQMLALLPLAQAEFARQLRAAQLSSSSQVQETGISAEG